MPSSGVMAFYDMLELYIRRWKRYDLFSYHSYVALSSLAFAIC